MTTPRVSITFSRGDINVWTLNQEFMMKIEEKVKDLSMDDWRKSEYFQMLEAVKKVSELVAKLRDKDEPIDIDIHITGEKKKYLPGQNVNY